MLSQTNSGGGNTIYSLSDLVLPESADIELSALPDRKGISFINRSGAALSYTLQIESVDVASGLASSNRLGPITVPAGAAIHNSFPDWPNTTKTLSSLDAGNDGTVDQTEIISAERALSILIDQDHAILRWRVSRSGAEKIEFTETLLPSAK